ncbi:MAG TPA: hypothetical protein VKH16_09405 [Gemmatimonadales bacterium]|nr:hypothetical protein [Gemmatimonadales bacterium]
MIRRTLLALALLAAPAIVVAQQPSPMQGQAPAADTSKAAMSKSKKKSAKKSTMKKHAKPAAKPAAKDTTKTKM